MTDAAPTIRRDVTYRGFRLPGDAGLGSLSGLRAGGRGLELADPADRLDHTDADGRTRRYAAGSWTSPPVPVGFAVRDVVPSWTGDTPATAGCGWSCGAGTTTRRPPGGTSSPTGRPTTTRSAGRPCPGSATVMPGWTRTRWW